MILDQLLLLGILWLIVFVLVLLTMGLATLLYNNSERKDLLRKDISMSKQELMAECREINMDLFNSDCDQCIYAGTDSCFEELEYVKEILNKDGSVNE